jgi:hypothetical protein
MENGPSKNYSEDLLTIDRPKPVFYRGENLGLKFKVAPNPHTGGYTLVVYSIKDSAKLLSDPRRHNICVLQVESRNRNEIQACLDEYFDTHHEDIPQQLG